MTKQYCKMECCGTLKEVPIVRQTAKGVKYCFFMLEIDKGKYKESFPFQAWGEKVEEIVKCKCGTLIEVKCGIKKNEYTNKNGIKIYEKFSPDAFDCEITIIKQPEVGVESIGAEDDEGSLPF